ncbi:MAG: hypothetical protein OHK0013_01590 [Sandaracinaceae bacterium]
MARRSRSQSPHALRLHEELAALSDSTEARERFPRAEAIERELEWLASYLARCSSSFRTEHAELVKAHIRRKVEEGRLSYRGEHGPASAMRLVCRIARNKLLDLLAKEKNEREQARRMAERASVEARDEAEREEAWRATYAMRELAAARLLRADDRETLRRIDLGLDHLLGESTEAQLTRFGYVAPGADEVAVERARQRLFQHRTRGRRAFSRWLGRFVVEGRIDPDDARLVCRHARLPLPRCLSSR